MTQEKKSFVLYLDAYPYISALPADQRGELLSALYWYAGLLETQTLSAWEAAEQCTQLLPETRMAFCFMAGALERDTRKWREKRANYLSAAARRQEERGSRTAGDTGSRHWPESRGPEAPKTIRDYL